jgi:hypothetical protein
MAKKPADGPIEAALWRVWTRAHERDGLSIAALARGVGVSRVALGQWALGHRHLSLPTAEALAKFFRLELVRRQRDGG